MVAVLLTHVAVQSEVMEEVVALKFGMVLNHPMVIRADVGFQNGGGYIGMVCGAQCIAYVMEQSADDVFFVFTVLVGEGGGLQAMG